MFRVRICLHTIFTSKIKIVNIASFKVGQKYHQKDQQGSQTMDLRRWEHHLLPQEHDADEKRGTQRVR